MYTFLINEDNTLTVSKRERIMERSKQVDTLHFLADTTYKDVDMSEFTVMLEYVLPISKRYKTEILQKSEELYKNKLEYKLPIDTNLTNEPGDIQIQLTFVDVTMDRWHDCSACAQSWPRRDHCCSHPELERHCS